MINKQMTKLIESRIKADPYNHVEIESIWEKEIEVLTFSLDETIKFLETSTVDEIIWSSEVWEDISMFFKSSELIEAMEKVLEKHPEIKEEIESSIDDAKLVLND